MKYVIDIMDGTGVTTGREVTSDPDTVPTAVARAMTVYDQDREWICISTYRDQEWENLTNIWEKKQ